MSATPFLNPEELLQQLAALMGGEAAPDDISPAVMDTLVALGDAARRVRGAAEQVPLRERPAAEIAAAIAAAYEKEAGPAPDLVRECDLAGKLVVGSPVIDKWAGRGIGMPVVLNDDVGLILNSFAAADANLRRRAHPLFCDAPEGLLPNLFIAGGACQRALVRDSAAGGDIDLFPILPPELHDAGSEEKRAWGEALLERLRAHVAGLHAERGVGPAHQSRTANCVTMVFSLRGDDGAVSTYELQFILRFAASPAEVLCRFDLGSSAVGWWNNEFVFSPLGAVAYQLGVNVLSLSCRRGTCEVRAVKYWKRGFALALPELATDRLPANTYATRLPRLLFSVTSEKRVNGRPFSPETLVARSCYMEAVSPVGRAQAAGYGPPPYESLADLREYNLRKLRTAERFGREPVGLVATQNNLDHGILVARPCFPAPKPVDTHRDARAACLWGLQTAQRFSPMSLANIGMDRGYIMMVTQLVIDGDLGSAREMVQQFRTPEELQLGAERARKLDTVVVPYSWEAPPPAPVDTEHSPLLSSARWYGEFHDPAAPAAFRVEPPAAVPAAVPAAAPTDAPAAVPAVAPAAVHPPE